jgi:hypothetical protein
MSSDKTGNSCGKNNTNREIVQRNARKGRVRRIRRETKQNKAKKKPCVATSFGCSGHFKMFLKTVFSLYKTDQLSP